MTTRILQGRYQVDRQLGAGGMGAVYHAVDLRFRNAVAVKESLCAGPELARAFEREARLLRGLRHPRLPGVIDYFEEGGRWYLVMDYVPGEDLWTMMRRRGQPFAVADVLAWADQLLDVLEYLHGQNPPIIHRDIKPQNLKLTPQGEVLLLDFGLSKGLAGETSRLSDGRSVQGYTPGFAPIEQILGQGTGPRSDLFSVGATMYCLVTGRPPVDAGTRHFELYTQGRPDPLPRADEVNRAVPRPVADAIAAAMADSASARPASAAAMRAMLRSAAAGETVWVPPPVARATREQLPERTVAPTVVETDRGRPPATAPSSTAPRRTGLLVAAALLLLFVGGAGLVALIAFYDESWLGSGTVEPPSNTNAATNAATNTATNAATNTSTPAVPRIPKLSQSQANAICAKIYNSYECAQAVEKYQLGKPEYAPYASRSGKSLELTLRNGGTVTYVDSGSDANVTYYCLREYLPEIGYFLLHRQYYEGSSYVLVDDRRGQSYGIDGLPQISPDRRRVVAASLDLEAGYSPNRLTVLRLEEGGLETEATVDSVDWGPSDPVWTDATTIDFTKNYATGEPGQYRKTPARLVLRNGKWVEEATGAAPAGQKS